jgi:hypothetical protein
MSRRHRRRDPVAQEMRDLAIWTSLTPGQQKQPKWQRRIEGWRRVYQLCIEAGLPPPGESIQYSHIWLHPTQKPVRRRRRRRQPDAELDALMRPSAPELPGTDKPSDGPSPGSPDVEPVLLPWSDGGER